MKIESGFSRHGSPDEIPGDHRTIILTDDNGARWRINPNENGLNISLVTVTDHENVDEYIDIEPYGANMINLKPRRRR